MLEKTDKNIYRKIKILKLLNDSNDGLKVGELAQFLNLSLKTIQNELCQLMEELKKSGYAAKIEKFGNRYKFIKKDTINMDQIYLYLKKDSIAFYLIQKAISSQDTLEKGEINYFYSSSHLYKNKCIFRDYLKKYSLELDIKSLSIVGDEMNIRFFYFQFIWENYRGVEWPFNIINRRDLLKTINKLNTNLFTTMSEIEKEQFLYWLAIIKIRESNDQLLSDNDFKLDRNIFGNSQEFEQILGEIIETCEANTLCLETTYLYYIFTLITEHPVLKKQLLMDLKKEPELFWIFRMATDLINKFSYRFSLDKRINFVDGYFSMYKLFYYEIHYNGSLREYYPEYMYKLNDINFYEKEFSQLYLETMNKYGKKYAKNMYLYQRVCTLFSILVDDTNYFPKITIKLLYSGGAIEERLLIKKIESLSINIKVNDVESKNPDIIVSDLTLNDYEDNLVFYWSSYPTEKEWRSLTFVILEISKNKKFKNILI